MVAASRSRNIPEQVGLVDSKGCGDALRPALAARRRFVAAIRGPLAAGKTTALAAVAAAAVAEFGVSLCQFALLAPTAARAHMLRRVVADLHRPGVALEEVLFPDMTGGVADVAFWRGPRARRATEGQMRIAAEEFAARIARAGELADAPGDHLFLRARRRDVLAVFLLAGRARLAGRPLADMHAEERGRGMALPEAFSMVAEIADFYAEFKHREGIVDDADILAGPLYPAPDCPLVLVDDADAVGPTAQAAIMRLFPRAALVAAGGPGGMIDRLWAEERTLRLALAPRAP